jgi:geranylgeranyl diphosphate/geranylgeranyl-bacteriochlorophyllide a reductase
MVDRDTFDEWLRERAAAAGAERRTGLRAHRARRRRHAPSCTTPRATPKGPSPGEGGRAACARAASSAPTARARRWRARPCRARPRPSFVFAYHEILRAPAGEPGPTTTARAATSTTAARCRPTSTAGCSRTATPERRHRQRRQGLLAARAVGRLREATGLAGAETLRREGAPIPLKPLPRWDNGRDVVLAGDAAGVVAPASGEGIYYAMLGGRWRPRRRSPSWPPATRARSPRRASAS